MTDAELDRLEALANAATPGPWEASRRDGEQTIGARGALLAVARIAQMEGWRSSDMSDADFIARTREAVPELVAEVRRLRAEVASARREGAEATREACARTCAAEACHSAPNSRAEELLFIAAAAIRALPLPGDEPAKETP